MIYDLMMRYTDTSNKCYYTTQLMCRNLLNNDCHCTSRRCLHDNNTLRIVNVTIKHYTTLLLPLLYL